MRRIADRALVLSPETRLDVGLCGRCLRDTHRNVHRMNYRIGVGCFAPQRVGVLTRTSDTSVKAARALAGGVGGVRIECRLRLFGRSDGPVFAQVLFD